MALADAALHVERAAPPHLPVDEVARPGVAIPLGRVREHRVGVGEERERGPIAAGEARFAPLYPDELPLAGKIRAVATRIYRAADVSMSPAVEARLRRFEAAGFARVDDLAAWPADVRTQLWG